MLHPNTEAYFGHISLSNKNNIQDNLRVQDVLFDTKDFFDRALNIDEYVSLSIGHRNSFTGGSIKDKEIDDFDINGSQYAGVTLRTYARNANFKGLAKYLKQQVRIRGRDYCRLLDGLAMEFDGSYLDYLFDDLRLLRVKYRLDFVFNESDESFDIIFNVVEAEHLDYSAADIRLAFNLFTIDNYTIRGMTFIQRLLLDIMKGKYNQSPYPEINKLVVKIKKFFLNTKHLYGDIEDLLSIDNITKFFYKHGEDERLVIGTESALEMLLEYNDSAHSELLQS